MRKPCPATASGLRGLLHVMCMRQPSPIRCRQSMNTVFRSAERWQTRSRRIGSSSSRLGVSSRAAPKYFEIRARQAERDEFLNCPPGYSAERDLKRRDELVKKWRRSMAEETELAFVIARITASEAAFNRSPEGRARRRIAALQYRRDAANKEKNRRVGLTRAEGKELDELLKRYRAERAARPVPGSHHGGFRRFQSSEGASRSRGIDPDSEMEELAPTAQELSDRRTAEKAELIERRKAAGDPDPWDGKAPIGKIE